MILHAQAKHGKSGLPWLVFLHGFSGDCREWQETGEAFADYSRLYVDLPGHGGSGQLALMVLRMSLVYCVKPLLVTISLITGWWDIRLADVWR